jgi:hypothetical protein
MGEAKGLSRKQFMRAGFYGIGGLGVGKGFYNTGSSNIEQVNVDIKIKNLPPSFHGYKIAHMSDFHSSMLVPGDLLSEAVDVAMSAKPDMIALTGDFLTVILNMYHPRYVDRLADAFASMSAPSGIFAVMGNHDIGCGNEAMAKLEKALSEMAGVQWLRNKNVEIKKGDGVIDLIGTDDYWAQSLSLRKSYVGLEKGRVRVMLSHNPDINELVTATGKRIDLILSGHTHGGQIIIPLLGAPHVPSNHGLKYLAGLVKDGERQTYVTRGVGHVIVPIRFNCPPEVTIITLV